MSELSRRKVTVKNLMGTGKVAKSFDPIIRERLIDILANWLDYVKSFDLFVVEEGQRFSPGEGDKMWRIDANGEMKSLFMESAETADAHGHAMAGAMNKFFTPSVGEWVVTIGYLGGYMMWIYNIVPNPKGLPPGEPEAPQYVFKTPDDFEAFVLSGGDYAAIEGAAESTDGQQLAPELLDAIKQWEASYTSTDLQLPFVKGQTPPDYILFDYPTPGMPNMDELNRLIPMSEANSLPTIMPTFYVREKPLGDFITPEDCKGLSVPGAEKDAKSLVWFLNKFNRTPIMTQDRHEPLLALGDTIADLDNEDNTGLVVWLADDHSVAHVVWANDPNSRRRNIQNPDSYRIVTHAGSHGKAYYGLYGRIAYRGGHEIRPHVLELDYIAPFDPATGKPALIGAYPGSGYFFTRENAQMAAEHIAREHGWKGDES